MSVIEFKDLTLSVPDKKILSDFNAKIFEGELIGIFGANGSGKTTLLRSILGLHKFEKGQIIALDKTKIGYMPQLREYHIAGQISGWEHLASTLNGSRWGFPYLNKKQKIKVNKIISLVGAEEFIHRAYLRLSGGERQRLNLAQALLNQPKILLLDEPLGGLDPGQQEKMLELINVIRKELNITILLTAHDFNPLLEYMNRLIYLAIGKAAIGTIDEIVTSSKLSWLYNSPIEVIRHQNRLFVIHKLLGSNVYDLSHTHLQ
jgi:zinc/manganese transport system ATP-binding protein